MADKILININESKPGMILANDICNKYGVVIVPERTVLDIGIINRLAILGIEEIEIDNALNRPSFKSTVAVKYSDNVQKIRALLNDISNGRDINLEKVNMVSDSILLDFKENRNVFDCIHQIRTADEYTYNHCVNVSLISLLIGKWMDLDDNRLRVLVKAGLLHDVGKSQIPDEILNKPGKLTDEEFSIVKKHSKLGFDILSTTHIDENISNAALMHHEREDGTGYILGLKSVRIHEYAKIVAVADIFDAMTSNRVYKKKKSPFAAFDFFKNEAFSILDQKILDIFLNNLPFYYVNDYVKLDDGRSGQIIFIDPANPSRPVIKAKEDFIDLRQDNKRKIMELIRA